MDNHRFCVSGQQNKSLTTVSSLVSLSADRQGPQSPVEPGVAGRSVGPQCGPVLLLPGREGPPPLKSLLMYSLSLSPSLSLSFSLSLSLSPPPSLPSGLFRSDGTATPPLLYPLPSLPLPYSGNCRPGISLSLHHFKQWKIHLEVRWAEGLDKERVYRGGLCTYVLFPLFLLPALSADCCNML